MMNQGVQGIDVSGYNTGTNWIQVKASGIAFAFIKATEGITYLNPYFRNDWANSKSAGIIRGAYHFFHPKDDPVKQANYFLSVMGHLSLGDLPAVLDLEIHSAPIKEEVASALIWLETIEKATGKTPIIYSGHYFIDELANPPEFEKYHLWLAGYTSTPQIPKPWNGYTFWQHSDSGKVLGVNGFCDLSVAGGDLAWLTEFSNQTV